MFDCLMSTRQFSHGPNFVSEYATLWVSRPEVRGLNEPLSDVVNLLIGILNS